MDYWQIQWKEFKNGSNSAFNNIYYKYVDILFRYGSKIISDKEMVKDGIQQLFLELYSSREKLSNPESIEFYLLKALKRILIHQLKKDQRTRNLNSYDFYSFTIDFDFEYEFGDKEKQQSKEKLLKEALNTLTSEKKELIFLKFYSGLNNKQIGSMLGLKTDTVQKQIYRILKKLQVKYISHFLELFILFANQGLKVRLHNKKI